MRPTLRGVLSGISGARGGSAALRTAAADGARGGKAADHDASCAIGAPWGGMSGGTFRAARTGFRLRSARFEERVLDGFPIEKRANDAVTFGASVGAADLNAFSDDAGVPPNEKCSGGAGGGSGASSVCIAAPANDDVALAFFGVVIFLRLVFFPIEKAIAGARRVASDASKRARSRANSPAGWHSLW